MDAADVAGGPDDELQQAARGRRRFRAHVEARLLAHDRQQQPRIGAVLPRLLGDVLEEVARVEQLAHQRRQQLGKVTLGELQRGLDGEDRAAARLPAAQRLRARDPGGQRLQRVAGDDVLDRVVEQAEGEQEVQSLRLLGRGVAEQRQPRVSGRRRLEDLAITRDRAIDLAETIAARGAASAGADRAPPPSAACARPPCRPARPGRRRASHGPRPPSAAGRPAAPGPGGGGRSTRSASACWPGARSGTKALRGPGSSPPAPAPSSTRPPARPPSRAAWRDRLQRGQRLGSGGRPRPSPPHRPVTPPRRHASWRTSSAPRPGPPPPPRGARRGRGCEGAGSARTKRATSSRPP